MAWTAVIPLAASAIQAANQSKVNSANIAANQERFSQEVGLANTSHQREVQDLLAAGLNPILSAGGSGASVPSLAPYQSQNPLSGLTHSGESVARYMSEQYRQNVLAQKLDNEGRSISNEIAQKDYDRHLAESVVAQKDAALAHDIIEAREGMSAKQYGRYIKLLGDGLEADAKNQSNVNWRNNLGAVSGAVNSAAGVMRSVPRQIPEITERHIFHHR